MYNDYMKKLNKNQFEAVTFTSGPALVIAGPGSGKTSVLTYRVARLLENGTSPERILLLTFTNKAAKEMLERINELEIYETDENSEYYEGKITACTYHSFCVNQLRKYASYIDYKSDFNVIDNNDTIEIIKILLEENKDNYIELCKENFFTAKDFLKIFNEYLNTNNSIEEIIDDKYSIFQDYKDIILNVYNDFVKYKKDNNLMTYTDLLFNFLQLLKENENICEKLSNQFKYIMVDEYQDSNNLQFSIIKELRKFDNKNIMVVGDDFQSIYAFNFANINNILDFPKIFTGCKIITLDINYRSNQEIVDVCNSIIESGTKKFNKSLKSCFIKNKKPYIIKTYNKEKEAEFIVNKILDYKKKGQSLKNIAVLIRNSRDSIYLEILLSKYGINFHKFGGTKFLEKKYVKDIFSYLKLIINKSDELSWFRILKLYSSIGNKTANNIAKDIIKNDYNILIDKKYSTKKYYNHLREIHEVLNKLEKYDLKKQLNFLLESYYFDLVNNNINNSNKKNQIKIELLQENNKNKKESLILYDLSKNYNSALNFLTDIVLETPTINKNEDFLNISTIHSSKGLEYEVGFILDCVEGTIPAIRNSSFGFDEEEEERRIFYVAVSRIKNDLYILIPEYLTTFNGKTISTEFSRYLLENDTYKLFDIKKP